MRFLRFIRWLLKRRTMRLPGMLALLLLFSVTVVLGAPGDVLTTPITPMEVPIEVEIETSPAGSLKDVPQWKELAQLLEDPYAEVERRPSFNPGPDGILGNEDDEPLPDLNVWALNENFLTGQPMRLRTSDGEVSLDQPGPLFEPTEDCLDPDSTLACNILNTPTEVRTPIGHLVACPNDPPYEAVDIGDFCQDVTAPNGEDIPGSSLVVYNPPGHPAIPPHGTVVAVEAYFDGMLHELEGPEDGEPWEGEYEEIVELEQPVNENMFFRDPADASGIPGPLRPLIGRPAAEILGKALFWDMQVGSDGVQACASCHFAAGADPRTKAQLNSGTNAGDLASLEVAGANEDVVATDFPFHMLNNPNLPSEDPANPNGTVIAGNVIADSNDVMSSMGVSRFKEFADIPAPGGGLESAAFVQVDGPVKPVAPDIGIVVPDPIPAQTVEIVGDGIGDEDGNCDADEVCQSLRRIEPRNTPTFHNAAFNFDNFWNSRARFNFSGGSSKGKSDPFFHIWVNDGTAAGAIHGLPSPSEETIELPLYQWAAEPGEEPVPARILFSSLASQAVEPPLSAFEMSFNGRNWQKIGKKLLQVGVTPLANQRVSDTDSVLGPFSNGATPGISLSYPQLIRLAFDPQLWANRNNHLNGAPLTCASADNGDVTPDG